ncbi:MAG TPA: hypothetical protein VMA74_09890 [Dyella sp.]|uniref:hypothetical protein n=1 Tax=Dyella sp. TaxID=1869338 RepID=UPI002BB12044|nr:hypothetical protein [Dyella sp.]HUB90023.1 hypothetical protein [Dyella sp.]
MDYANWMTDTPDVLEKTLAQLVLPEAHDAGTYDVDGGLLPPGGPWGAVVAYLDALGLGQLTGPIVSAFTKAQPQPILQQLRGGVRVLDLRVCWDNGFHIHHGPIVCGTLQAVLADIQAFLAETRHELVVVVASHFAFDTYPAHDDPLTALGRYVIQQLGTQALVACPADPATYLRRAAVKTITAEGSKVLFAVESNTLDPALRSHIWHPALYTGGYADTTDLAVMVDREQQRVNAHAANPSGSLFQLQWLLTPDADYIIRQIEQAIAVVGINPGAILAYLDQHGLKQLAQRAHNALGAFMAKNRHASINTLRVDYCVGSPAIDLAITLSRAPAPPTQGQSEQP